MVIIHIHNHHSNSHDSHCHSHSHWPHHLQPQPLTTIIPKNCNPPHPKQNNHPQNLHHHHPLRLQPAKAPPSIENPLKKTHLQQKTLPPKIHLQPKTHWKKKPTFDRKLFFADTQLQLNRNPPPHTQPSCWNPTITLQNLSHKSIPATKGEIETTRNPSHVRGERWPRSGLWLVDVKGEWREKRESKMKKIGVNKKFIATSYSDLL